MREFEARIRIAAPVERVFDFVADYRNVPRVLDGISRWEPVTERSRGAGARFDVEMRTLGVPLENVLVLDRWEPPRAIGWHSEAGLIEQRGGWTFTAAGDGVEVVLRIAYQPRGAALGNLLASRADGLVRRRLEQALERTRRLLEAPASRPAPAPRARTPRRSG
jgi:uncharacterized membrane protein